ncbi:30S ribosomal protein S6 [Patescibacteria group bacterium]|nr:30S ribosomal protein S6 [Patescibacteria group bacterium]
MYELLYIVPTPFTEKDLDKIAKQTKEIISSLDGKITKEKNLGSRKLAYPIKQIHRGFYLLVNFEIAGEKIQELDQKLKLTPEILRHIIIKIVVTKKRPVKVKKEEPVVDEKKLAKDSMPEKQKDTEKSKKIDLKKLGEKIDELFKI